tara:strand:- start:10274 stop:10585 length:312 start_codon:yes stop_codon:yes gene_type:complete
MATIVKRSRKEGSIAWLARIVIRRGGRIILRVNKTSERRSTASAWPSLREEPAGEPESLESALQTKSDDNRFATLADAIDRYVRESNRKIGRTKNPGTDSRII